MKNYLTVDVGGTAIKYALMSEEAEILEKGEVPTPMDGLEVYLDTLTSLYKKYEGRVEAFVMSAPGRIDSKTGYFFTSGALKYVDETDLGALMKERISVPFAAENDAKAAALAELWKGSMKGIDTGTVITLGTAIGGAIIIDGKLYRGNTFAAGEYSNICMDWMEPLRPHYAWYRAGGVGMLCLEYAKTADLDPTKVDGRVVFEATNNGDEKANAALRQYCYRMAGGIFSLQVILDMQRVAIGGGISKQPLLMKYMNEEMDHIMEAKSPSPVSRPEIVSCTFGNDANMIGALYHYLYELEGKDK